MAIEEINGQGGVNGRPLEIFSRDSKMEAGEAVKLADELIDREKVSALVLGEFSSGALAIGNWADHNKIPVIETLADADSIIWEHGNPYMFRILGGGYNQTSAMFKRAQAIYGDKLKNKRWAVIGPNYEYGHSLYNAAKIVAEQSGLNPQWVVEQWPAYGKLEAGASILALQHAEPDIILCLLLTDDLAKFVREGNKRGLFKNKIILSPAAAYPEHLDVTG